MCACVSKTGACHYVLDKAVAVCPRRSTLTPCVCVALFNLAYLQVCVCVRARVCFWFEVIVSAG